MNNETQRPAAAEETDAPTDAAPVTDQAGGRRVGWKTLAALACLVVLAVVGVKEGRWHVLPKRWLEVEPGLYRSGQLEEWPFDRMVREHGIKTVLRLNPLLPADPRRQVEAGVVSKNGLKFVEVPMPNGSGIVPFPDLEQAADILADHDNWPILFHCSAGSRRSSAVQAVYRWRHCGWTWEQEMAELEEQGLIPMHPGAQLLEHLRKYHQERIVTGEGLKAPTQPPATPAAH